MHAFGPGDGPADSDRLPLLWRGWRWHRIAIDAAIEQHKKQVDMDLLRAHLKLTVEQRLVNLMFNQLFAIDLAKRIEAILGLPHQPLWDSGSY